jgi:sec-independent protein translocase protein TatA
MEFSMFGFGATELGIILVIVVILFGARRLPEIGAGVGKAIKNFKAGISGDDEIDVTLDKGDVPRESDKNPPRE